MDMEKNKKFGQLISRLLVGQNLNRDESYQAFGMILNDEVTDMQQGGFLAALTGKGETAEEVAGGWQAVYDLDTRKVDLSDLPIVDNCGTGMDSFKTFNISTAASLVAAAGGVKIARHGARAITSSCGTVDMAECLGVDVECPVSYVENSVRTAGIGLFNGMSPMVHPMALGRILSKICFGSPLNIAASLAHPAMPRKAVRGVYSQILLWPVAEVMRDIGYSHALLVYGTIDHSSRGMDEASVCGPTMITYLHEGTIREFSATPEEFGLRTPSPELLAADATREKAAVNMYRLLAGRGCEARLESVMLNSGMLFFIDGKVSTIKEGVKMARELLLSGKVLNTLKHWVGTQNADPAAGLEKLDGIARLEAQG